MGITKKGKRKIVIDGRTYFWRGFNEQDQTTFDGDQIQLVAEDQSHTISYGLQQDDGKRFAAIRLRHEQGSICLECPKFEDQNGIITPSGIRKLVEWCKTRPDDSNLRVLVPAYYPKKNNRLPEEELQKIYEHILNLLNPEEFNSKL